jgi:hypothetical protein
MTSLASGLALYDHEAANADELSFKARDYFLLGLVAVATQDRF